MSLLVKFFVGRYDSLLVMVLIMSLSHLSSCSNYSENDIMPFRLFPYLNEALFLLYRLNA